MNKIRNILNNEKYKIIKPRSYLIKKALRRHNNKIITELKNIFNKCQNCNYSVIGRNNLPRLHAAHIIPYNKHYMDVTYDNKLNIFVLCPNCHDLYDHGTLKQSITIYNNIIEKYKDIDYVNKVFEKKTRSGKTY